MTHETRKVLGWIKTEICAGEVLFPHSDVEKAFNVASERAIRIIENYVEGLGIFQLTEPRGENAPSPQIVQKKKKG